MTVLLELLGGLRAAIMAEKRIEAARSFEKSGISRHRRAERRIASSSAMRLASGTLVHCVRTPREESNMTSDRQTHIVLVPGFGGFDALGQIEYYAGVTPVFHAWSDAATAGSPASRATLRYFDNLPTAAVRTRATLLHDYLAKRIARREFQPGDRIALVGHSTGGLDIRQLLSTLFEARDGGRARPVDGDADRATAVAEADLLSRIERLCFLSVPQRGTNIANCVQVHIGAVHAEVGLLNGAVRASHVDALAGLERRLAGERDRSRPGRTERTDPVDAPTVPHVLLAARDALLETLPPRDASDGYAAALARAAFGELTGFLGNVSSDFLAIDDLACTGPTSTPARYSDADRATELEKWAGNGIRTRSYATLGRRPFDREPTRNGDRVRSTAELAVAFAHLDGKNQTDSTYRVAYAACAAGPFRVDPNNDAARDETGALRRLAAWENDGIVNTASMLWPDGPDTTLVPADHGDIIGHYRLSASVSPEDVRSGRENHTYDIFRSSSGFDEARFNKIWRDVFEFCVSS